MHHRVAQGATLLDQHVPDWESKIDLINLVAYRGTPVCCQLFATSHGTASFFGWDGDIYTNLQNYGFMPCTGPYVEAVWHDLNVAWADVIRARQESAN